MAKKEKKVKGPESVGFKEIFGVTALSTNNGLANVFMSSLFMIFMTDYAGLGSWGATLATTLLLAARIIDAVDDPIQGFIMDNGKVGKHGKYKPFFMLSIIMTTIGTIALYMLPDGITNKPVVVSIWVILFYFLYDIGMSFYQQNLLFRNSIRKSSALPRMILLHFRSISEISKMPVHSPCRISTKHRMILIQAIKRKLPKQWNVLPKISMKNIPRI